MELNKEWHLANKMPANPTLDQRIKWHLEHVKHCKCRNIPEKLQKEINNRRIVKK